MADRHEMSGLHRRLLHKHRAYIHKNLYLGEEFWSELIAEEVLTMDMVEEIKEEKKSEQPGILLDLLEKRGPHAFDMFCHTLVKTDQGHVADKLRHAEAREKVVCETIKPHLYTASDDVTTNIEKKLDKILYEFQNAAKEDGERNLGNQQDSSEREIQELEAKINALEGLIKTLKQIIKSCSMETRMVVNELHDQVRITPDFLTTERQRLDSVRRSNEGSCEDECIYACDFTICLNFVLDHILELQKPCECKTRNGKSCHSDNKIRPPTPLMRTDSMQSRNNVPSGRRRDSYHRKISSTHGPSNEDLHPLVAGDMQKLNQLVRQLGIKVAGNRTVTISEPQVDGMRETCASLTVTTSELSQLLDQKSRLEEKVLSLYYYLSEQERLETDLQQKQEHYDKLTAQQDAIRQKNKRHIMLKEIQKKLDAKRSEIDAIKTSMNNFKTLSSQISQDIPKLIPDRDDSSSICPSEHNSFVKEASSDKFITPHQNCESVEPECADSAHLDEEHLDRPPKKSKRSRSSEEYIQTVTKDDNDENSQDDLVVDRPSCDNNFNNYSEKHNHQPILSDRDRHKDVDFIKDYSSSPRHPGHKPDVRPSPPTTNYNATTTSSSPVVQNSAAAAAVSVFKSAVTISTDKKPDRQPLRLARATAINGRMSFAEETVVHLPTRTTPPDGTATGSKMQINGKKSGSPTEGDEKRYPSRTTNVSRASSQLLSKPRRTGTTPRLPQVHTSKISYNPQRGDKSNLHHAVNMRKDALDVNIHNFDCTFDNKPAF